MNASTKAEINTAWTGWLRKTDSIGNFCGATGVGGPDLGSTIAEIHQTATYMHAIGYTLRIEGLRRECRTCGGSGSRAVKISKACPAGERKCRACRGVGIFEAVPDFDINKSRFVTITQIND